LNDGETLSSRGVLIVGMHRSGTSAVARGLKPLSVYLGSDFLDAQPENPTGYWEDRGIVDLNESVLKALGLKWDDAASIAEDRFRGLAMWRLRRKAMRYIRRKFAPHPLWGFKDPRTIRLLPFWVRVLRDCHIEDAYVVVVRNPLSIAASLFRRQEMDRSAAYRLWFVYMVPFFHELRKKKLVVVDYDLLMQDPRAQLRRIASSLHLPLPEENGDGEINVFANEFLDNTLRHSIFSSNDFDMATPDARLTHSAYLLLYELATDRLAPSNESFWLGWSEVARSLRR
jgi:hypothetical protein